jgi:hypothetical protein
MIGARPPRTELRSINAAYPGNPEA